MENSGYGTVGALAQTRGQGMEVFPMVSHSPLGIVVMRDSSVCLYLCFSVSVLGTFVGR